MNYTNEQIRRQDRLLEKEKLSAYWKRRIRSFVHARWRKRRLWSSYQLCMEQEKFHLHSLCSRRTKLHCIKRCNTVSFCIIGKTHIISNQFTTEYESIILKCRAYIGLNEEERINALHLLIEKYSPNDKVIGNQYAQNLFTEQKLSD